MIYVSILRAAELTAKNVLTNRVWRDAMVAAGRGVLKASNEAQKGRTYSRDDRPGGLPGGNKIRNAFAKFSGPKCIIRAAEMLQRTSSTQTPF